MYSIVYTSFIFICRQVVRIVEDECVHFFLYECSIYKDIKKNYDDNVSNENHRIVLSVSCIVVHAKRL